MSDHLYFCPDENAKVNRFLFACDEDNCSKVYKSKSELNQHLKRTHKIQKNEARRAKCLEPGCNQKFCQLKQLQKHLERVHKIEMKYVNITFSTYSDFSTWLTDIQTDCRFTKTRGDLHSTSKTSLYYQCNRSGEFKPKGIFDRKRRVKAQGSLKIGSLCTAAITAEKTGHGSLNVRACLTHYGHGYDLGHQVLQKSDKDWIASQLQEKVAIQAILDKIRTKVSPVAFKVIDLTDRQTIQNIERQYGLCGSQRNADDRLSVLAWIKEEESNPNNPVILFKDIGETGYGLTDEDFALAMMDEAQCFMLKTYGGKAVCMDATHGTNPYDFKLVTILVVDQFNEGYPCAFFFSNKEDETALKAFLRAVAAKTGPIDSDIFMSDDAAQYNSAWAEVMGPTNMKLLCSWHVDRAWRQNLKKIGDPAKQIEAYHMLKVLHEETNLENFKTLLEKVIKQLLADPLTAEFGEYFRSYYLHRVGEWAYAYRHGAVVNTNMHLESLHRVIKHVYMGGLKIKRLDKSINLLLKVARDKQFKRVRGMFKGHLVPETRHAKIDKMDFRNIKGTDDGTYLVSSNRDCSSTYKVKENANNAAHKLPCPFWCKVCSACVHTYSCTCIDYLIRVEMCKHIHLVCQYLKKEEPHIPEDEPPSFPSPDQTELSVHLRTLSREGLSFEETKRKLLNKSQSLTFLIQEATSKESLEAITPQVDACINLMKMSSVKRKLLEPTVAASSEPANKKQKRQRWPTKKKGRKRAGVGKPTFFQKEDIKDLILN